MNPVSKNEPPQAKICLTAAGTLIHNNKILLIKHKKLQMWMSPGGHLDPDEMPHQAAEREFWEEAGIKVKAIPFGLMLNGTESSTVPNPYLSDLHWVSRENYEARTTDNPNLAKNRKYTGRSCEQHICFNYFVEAIDGFDFKQNIEETDGIAWFGIDEIDALETSDSIKLQIKESLRLRHV